MNISKVTANILPILKQNGKNLYEDVKDSRERLTKVLGELERFVRESQDVIELTKIRQVLNVADAIPQISRISCLAHGKLRSSHTTFLSQSAIEKSHRGYLEFLWSSAELLSDNSNLLASKRDKKTSDFVLPVDIDSLSEQLVSQFSSRFPPSITQRTFLSTARQILNYLGLTKPVKDRKALTKDILREVFLFMKYDEAPDLSFLDKKNPLAVQLLFFAIDYLGLNDFQKNHLEPFNKKFPKIPLTQAPRTVLSLDFSAKDVEGIVFSLFPHFFPHLEELDLSRAKNFTPAQINQIPDSIKVLTLKRCNVDGVDFSHFKNLEEIDLSGAKNLTPLQIGQIPDSVKVLKLDGCNVYGVDFSRFTNLEEIDFAWAQNLTPIQISQIPPSVKALKLAYCDVAGVDFSFFKNLEKVSLYDARNLTPAQINQIPASIKVLKLKERNVAGVDFSRFKNLEEIDLSYTSLTPAQINQIPASIKVLKLWYCNVAGFDFSRFTNLEEIDLYGAKNLTAQQLAQLPRECKVINWRLMEETSFSLE